ncbi:MAG: nitroreductase family protein [Cyclobacteriaceae bacterium]|nr:nitroreductase family protein [Cyclobacteriaceae bacterium]
MQFTETDKRAKTENKLNPLFENRWSPRSFSGEKVDKKIIKKFLEAASWSASSFNEQPWRFIVGIKGEGMTWDHIFDSVNEWNQQWVKNAPILILACAKKHFSRNQKENRHHFYDTGQAVNAMILQALEDEVYAHQMAGFDPAVCIDKFEIPSEFVPVVVVAMGYKGEPQELKEEYQKAELAERSRKALGEIAFTEVWEKAF